MFAKPRNDEAYSRAVLEKILSRRRLTFNPYTVSDKKLLELASSTGWGNKYDITQMVIINVIRLRPLTDYRRLDGIFVHVGPSENEVFIPVTSICRPVSAFDNLRDEFSTIGKRKLREREDVAGMVGHRYFVSRLINGLTLNQNIGCAYAFHRLYKNVEKNAATIRQAMIDAKIEMLERLLAYPKSPYHLSCQPDLFDYRTPILDTIERIRHFPDVIPPID